jgi:hypothetical protein
LDEIGGAGEPAEVVATTRAAGQQCSQERLRE